MAKGWLRLILYPIAAIASLQAEDLQCQINNGILECNETSEASPPPVTKRPPEPSAFSQGDESLPTKSFEPAYTAPANFALRESWDVFITGSYLYWNVGENGLDIAISAAITPQGKVLLTNQGRILFENTNSNSGFKVGLGAEVNGDESLLYLEYTSFHSDKSLSRTAPVSDVGQGIWYLTTWFLQPTPAFQQGFSASKVSSEWHVAIDWVDAILSRACYSGRSFILTPFAGLRSSWIRQRIDIKPVLVVSEGTAVSRNSSHEWGIGPRVGFDLSWLLGKGFKFLGELGAEILYARYSTRHVENDALASSFPIALSIRHFHTMRLGFETKLGLGWGTYFDRHRHHLNFSACYDLNYLCNENVFRNMVDTAATGSSDSLGDLYIQGLTFTGRLDF